MFSSLLTQQISLFFIPLVFAAIPAHFIPHIKNGGKNIAILKDKSFCMRNS